MNTGCITVCASQLAINFKIYLHELLTSINLASDISMHTVLRVVFKAENFAEEMKFEF